MNDINTIYDAITKRRCCSNGGSSDDSGSGVAPLIVRGEMGEFTPNSGQPTWDEAKAAFVSGRNVVIIAATPDGDEPIAEIVIAYNPYADTPLLHGGDTMYWLKPIDDGESGEGGGRPK